MPKTDRPTEEQIREALEWLESAAALIYDGPNEARVRTAIYLARRGALLDEAAELLRGVDKSTPAAWHRWLGRRDALLARIEDTP